MVTPVFANPFEREVVLVVGDRYEKGNVWFRPMPHFRPAGFGIETHLGDPAVQVAIASARAQAYLRWARFPFAMVDVTVPTRVWLNDYRYSNMASRGWSAVAVDLPGVE